MVCEFPEVSFTSIFMIQAKYVLNIIVEHCSLSLGLNTMFMETDDSIMHVSMNLSM